MHIKHIKHIIKYLFIYLSLITVFRLFVVKSMHEYHKKKQTLMNLSLLTVRNMT